MTAKFIGVGVGPGDPELITLKAFRYIQQADVISYISNEEGESQAKTIASDALSSISGQYEEIAVAMPMSDDRTVANKVYDKAAKEIKAALAVNKNVVFLCEGDPLFFGSFAYLLERLQDDQCCEVVPGISSVHAASSVLQLPLTMLRESFAVVSGRHSEESLAQTLNSHDSVVILKAGRSRKRILNALESSSRTAEASYLEYIGRESQHIERDIRKLQGESGPYFSLFVVVKAERDRS